MNVLKRLVVEDHLKQIGHHDQVSIYGGPAGDPGLTGPGSMSWEIHSDVAAIAIGGISAIIMEILHPSVMAGVQDMSTYREDPFRRSRTTYGYVVTTTFGSTVAATRLINAVKKMHERVIGVRPDGVPYEALDPELIGWVHTCIPWAVMTAFERYNRPLSAEEKTRYLSEQAVIGRMSGAGEIPETAADLDAYVEAMRPKLGVNAQTMEFFEFLLASPFGLPIPSALQRAGNRWQVSAGMGLMPEWAQQMSGFTQVGVERVVLTEPALQTYARTLRWAFGTPAFRRLADERVVGLSASSHAASRAVQYWESSSSPVV